MLLADELFCIAYDDRAGRPRVHPQVLGLGLAGALLGELVLFGRITLRDGEIYVVHRDPPLDPLPDPLAHTTLAQVQAYVPRHSAVRTWLAFLAETATDEVTQRLVRAGVLRRQEYRRFGRTRVAYLPVDVNKVAWRPVRLASRLTEPEPLDTWDVVLAGLVAVTGLTGVVLWEARLREPGTARLARAVRQLDRPLYDLLAFVEAAVGDAVLVPH